MLNGRRAVNREVESRRFRGPLSPQLAGNRTVLPETVGVPRCA